MATILCVEPDKVLAKTYAQALEHTGHTVNLVTNAEEAIVIADERRPDVLLLELQLASHNGIEFLHEFRSYEDWWDIPIIVNTHITPAALEGVERALRQDLGVAVVLYKPQTSLQKLISTVNEYVQKL